jgi:hypothetical protein
VVLESQRKHSLTNVGNENYAKRLTYVYYDTFSYPPDQEYVPTALTLAPYVATHHIYRLQMVELAVKFSIPLRLVTTAS